MTSPTESMDPECSNMSTTAITKSDLDTSPTTPQPQPQSHPQPAQYPDPPHEPVLEDTTDTFDITYPYFPNRIVRTLSIADSSTRAGAATPDSAATYNFDAPPSLWESRHHKMAQDMEDMKQDIQRLFRQTIDMQQKHKRDLEKVKAKHESEITGLEARNTKKIEDLVKAYDLKIEGNSARIVELENKYDSEITRIQKENAERTEELKRAYDCKIEGNSAKFGELEKKFDSENQRIQAEVAKFKAASNKKYSDLDEFAKVLETSHMSFENSVNSWQQKNKETINELTNELIKKQVDSMAEEIKASNKKFTAEMKEMQRIYDEGIRILAKTIGEKMAQIMIGIEYNCIARVYNSVHPRRDSKILPLWNLQTEKFPAEFPKTVNEVMAVKGSELFDFNAGQFNRIFEGLALSDYDVMSRSNGINDGENYIRNSFLIYLGLSVFTT
ncbi:hypothetical protein DFH27DRAFT_585902 [Peziza echinospora]|nr:hypothetical protein DFH27DRAFT_585902 [Peziza echinospora]